MTERLYFVDPLLTAFEARVVAHATYQGRPSVVLDRSAFYPEAGGQMADRGTLAGLAVVDVQEDEAGAVHHVLAGEAEGATAPGLDLPEVHAVVAGAIDRGRRKSHMALHTGQHMLSRALLDVVGGETVSSRLGETDCNIDLHLEKASDAGLLEAEDLVNSVIDDDLPVRAFFPTPGELAAIRLRRAPKVTDNIRVVEVEGFDFTPCGGTHVLRTGQIGLVRLLRTERVKGKLRVLFTAGPRARRQLFGEQSALYALARSFTCGPLDVEAAIERLRDEKKTLQRDLGAVRARLAETTAQELLREADASGAAVVIAAFDDADPAFLRVVAERITQGPRAALLAAPSSDGTFVFLARGDGSPVDCGALLAEAARATGGKGGGKPALAQGRLPGRVDWPALARSLVDGLSDS